MKNAKVEVIELDGGHNLADLLARLAEKGVTDFTRVRVEMNYSFPETNEDGCYYGPSTYSDVRLEWKINKEGKPV